VCFVKGRTCRYDVQTSNNGAHVCFTLSVIAQNTPLFWVLISSVLVPSGFGLSVLSLKTNKSTAHAPKHAVLKEVLYTEAQLEGLQKMLNDTGLPMTPSRIFFARLKTRGRNSTAIAGCTTNRPRPWG
jgi:hypothetical protein